MTDTTPVQGSGGTTTDTTTTKPGGIASLKPDDFIKLFLAQMKNQNPMQPTDSSAILQQMSQISQISASNDMQKTMKDLSTSVNTTLANSQVLQATQLIGKNVQIQSTVSPLIQDEGLSGSVMVPGPASEVNVSIMDSAGNTIQTIPLGVARSAGLMDFKWNGIDKNGIVMPPDFYHMVATSVVGGKAVTSQTAGSFKVNSVALDPATGVILNVDGLGGKSMGEIIKIM